MWWRDVGKALVSVWRVVGLGLLEGVAVLRT